MGEGGVGDSGYLSEVYRSAPPALRYLARALVDGSAAAATVFDDLVDLTEHHLAGRSPGEEVGRADLRAQAVVLTAMRLGITVLHEHVSRGLGVEVFSTQGGPRVGRASLDVLAPGLMAEGIAERARAGLDDFENRPHQPRPPTDPAASADREAGAHDPAAPADLLNPDVATTPGGRR